MTSIATHTKTYRRLVENTTINTKTLLSTDYLNHFNELIMLVDMLPDMPDMMEEISAWHPKTYHQHFEDSVFTHKDLACYAYDHVPPEYKHPFERTIERMNQLIADNLPEFDMLIAMEDMDNLREKVGVFGQTMQGYVDTASGVINGVQEAIDSEGHAEPVEESKELVMDQSDIDSLFD